MKTGKEWAPKLDTEFCLAHTPYPALFPGLPQLSPGPPRNEETLKFIPDKTPFRPAVISQTREGNKRYERALNPEAANLLGFTL